MTFSTFSFPTMTLFGAGALKELPQRLKGLGLERPLVVTDPGLVHTEAFAMLEETLGKTGRQKSWFVFSNVHPNPIEQDVIKGAEAYRANACDAVIAFGGGSALDAGKAVRLLLKRPGFELSKFDWREDWHGLAPCIAIPTTAGTGSEVGRSAVIIIDGRKQVIFDPKLLASLVILDPQLTVDLPAKLTAATGADALTHCIESFTSPVFHPMCEAIALEGLRIIARALPRAVHEPGDVDARGQMQLAAMMGGVAFQKDLGAVHSLAHPLSTLCNMHHGLANALCLAVVMRFNAQRKPGLYSRIAEVLRLQRKDDAAVIEWVQSLLRDIGITPGLKAAGVDEAMLEQLTDQAVEDGCHKTNAVPVTRDDLMELYRQAM